MNETDSQRDVEGFAFAAGTSFRRNARLVATFRNGEALFEVVTAENGAVAEARLDDVRIDPPLGAAPRKTTFPDGLVFETRDDAAVRALTGKTRGAALADLEAFRPRLLIVIALCLVAAWGIWRYGLDILVAGAIAATPPVLIEQMDAGTLRTIDLTMASPTRLPEEDRARIESIYRTLVAALPEDEKEDRQFALLFRDMPNIGPNAFALPGGSMVITDAFVEMFPEDDVIAGVIGHEIGHVVGDHGLKGLYRSLGAFVLIAFLAGDVGPILEDVLLEGNVLLSLSFGREQETEADEFGLTLAHRAGFDPAGLKIFFERIERILPGAAPPTWLSTHPSNEDRLDAIEAFIERL